MFRPGALLLIALLVGPLVPTGAQATDPLVVDAGNAFALLLPDTAAPLAGAAAGGTPPYTFAWSLDGEDTRFASPTSASTTLDLTGGAPGGHVVTLTVTDDQGAVASDTVVVSLEEPVVLVEETASFPPSALGLFIHDVEVPVPPGSGALRATLSWTDPANDLDLVLRRPNGNSASGNEGRTGDHPEVATADRPQEGLWTARVEGFLNAPETFTLLVEHTPLVEVRHNGPYAFGFADVQQLAAQGFGVDGVSVAWDLDGDLVFETPGADAAASLPVGTHDVAVKATSGPGHEQQKAAVISVTPDAPHVLMLVCSDLPSRPYKPMELSVSGGTCWMHGGHHTYYLGQGPVRLLGGTGRVASVEQPFAPPSEFDGLATPVVLETSLDGLTWTPVGVARYDFVGGVIDVALLGGGRQVLDVTLGPSEDPFRYLRVREPRSASQGLSGFLDASRLDLLVEPAGPAEPPARAQATRALDCAAGDVMEAFFDEHPCWFGGIDRYDAPSFFHTYPLGGHALLDGLEGSFTVAPWRTDDWFRPVTTDPSDITTTHVLVQRSLDAIAWETVASVPAVHGQETAFEVALHKTPARFVRLVPEGHRLFEEFRAEPSLHHPEAFLLGSRLDVIGELPVTS